MAAINWGALISKEAIPQYASIASGLARTGATNRTESNKNAVDAAKSAEEAAMDRARIAVDRDRLGMDQEKQAVGDALRAALMKNMTDMSFDRSGFRSSVPTVSFGGGLRPSALGAEGKALADVMNNRAMQTLMRPVGGDGASAGTGTGGVPAYQPAETKGASIWENVLGGVGLAGEAAGKIPGLFGKAATAAVPAAAGAATSGATSIPGVMASKGGSLVNALGAGGTSVTPWGGVPGLPGSSIDTSAITGLTPMADKLGPSFWAGANKFAGPAATVAGLVAPFLPAGKARTAADWASKGAQIGSFIPGIGTGIGAAAGAVAGAIKGHQNATVGDREDFAKKAGYQSLDALYKALEGMGPEGMELRRQGLNVIGKQDQKANQMWMGQVQSLLGRR